MASKVLADVVVYFNLKDSTLKNIAKRLGATVVDSISKQVTHIIVEDKQVVSRKMQSDAKNAHLVNKNWIRRCDKHNKRVAEGDYTVKYLGSPKQDGLLADKENTENESQKRGSQHHGLMQSSPRSGPSSQNLQYEMIGSNGSHKKSPRKSKSKRQLDPNQSTDGGYDSERDLFMSSDEREADQSSERLRCDNSFYTSPVKMIKIPTNDNLKILLGEGMEDEELTDDEGNRIHKLESRFADGSGQQTGCKDDLNDTTDDSTQVMDSIKKVNEDGKPGSESVDTADQHPQDDSLNRTEELNTSIFNREPSTQIIKDTTMALSVAMMLEHDWSSPGSLPPLETLKNQSPSPYNASTPIHITCQLDTENIVNAAMYKKRSDLNSLQVPEEQTDVDSVEITNDDQKTDGHKDNNNSNEEKNNSAKKRKRGLSNSTPARSAKRRKSDLKPNETQPEPEQSAAKPKLRRARTKEMPTKIELDIKPQLPLKRSTRSRRDPIVLEIEKNLPAVDTKDSPKVQHSGALKRSQRRHSKNLTSIRFLCSKCDESVQKAGATLAGMIPTLVTYDVEAETLVGITHVVICKNERTLKVLQAIARGLFLVSSQWLHDCVEQKKIIPADDYEAIEWFSGCRAAREAHVKGKLLFAGTEIWIEGETRVPVEELRNLILFAGGSMAKNRTVADVVISNEKLHSKQKTSAPVVSEKWILDSLVGWSILSFDEYCVS